MVIGYIPNPVESSGLISRSISGDPGYAVLVCADYPGEPKSKREKDTLDITNFWQKVT